MADMSVVVKLKAEGGEAAAAHVRGVEAALKGLGTEATTAEGPLGRFAGHLGGPLAIAAGAAILAVGGVVEVLGHMVEQAAEAQRVMAQTNAVIASTQGVAGVTAAAAVELAESLGRIVPVDDDVIQATENMLLTFTRIHSEVFPQATEAALDMSIALGEDAKTAAIQLGKALQDPIAGVTALRRVGVVLTESQKEQIKAFVESGDVMSAQKVILQELQTEFGGTARAAGQTFSGQLTILNTQIKNVGEAIGGALLPALSELAVAAVDVVKELSDEGVFTAIAQAIRTVVVPAIRDFIDGIHEVIAVVAVSRQGFIALSEAGLGLAAATGGDLVAATEHFRLSQAAAIEGAKIQSEALNAQTLRELTRAGATLDGSRATDGATAASGRRTGALGDETEAQAQSTAQTEVHAAAMKIIAAETMEYATQVDAATRMSERLNATQALGIAADQDEAERHRALTNVLREQTAAQQALGEAMALAGAQGAAAAAAAGAGAAGTGAGDFAKTTLDRIQAMKDALESAGKDDRERSFQTGEDARLQAIKDRTDADLAGIAEAKQAEADRFTAALAGITVEKDSRLAALDTEKQGIENAAQDAAQRQKLTDAQFALRQAQTEGQRFKTPGEQAEAIRKAQEAVAAAQGDIDKTAHLRDIAGRKAGIDEEFKSRADALKAEHEQEQRDLEQSAQTRRRAGESDAAFEQRQIEEARRGRALAKTLGIDDFASAVGGLAGGQSTVNVDLRGATIGSDAMAQALADMIANSVDRATSQKRGSVGSGAGTSA